MGEKYENGSMCHRPGGGGGGGARLHVAQEVSHENVRGASPTLSCWLVIGYECDPMEPPREKDQVPRELKKPIASVLTILDDHRPYSHIPQKPRQNISGYVP